jgi:predicted alpha-1,6-mannanase (GH76 family)
MRSFCSDDQNGEPSPKRMDIVPRTIFVRNAALVGIAACLCFALASGEASSTPTANSGNQPAEPTTNSYAQEAAEGMQTLQRWYVQSSGLYQSPTGWWNAANAITVLVNYSRVTHSTQFLSAVANTFANANAANGSQNFITSANDDEGWWALAWIDAYDLTKTPAYLSMAQTIFSDLTTQWDTTTCGGGIWWSKDLKTSAYKNAVTNELFLTIAASLANRVSQPSQKAQYLNWAIKEWQWFDNSGMINTQHLINDGLKASNPAACVNNRQTTWTYNQGVIQGGLLELYKANHDYSLITTAQTIATAAITNLVPPTGVLQEPSISGPDGPQFKGIFVRNLMELNQAFPNPEYRAFVTTNVNSIWLNDQGPAYKFGVYWQGPFDSADATRQTSALDVFIAALQMSVSP